MLSNLLHTLSGGAGRPASGKENSGMPKAQKQSQKDLQGYKDPKTESG